MLIIEWLNRLPDAEGVIILKQTATNCDTVLAPDAEAGALWPFVQTIDHRVPDGFQLVDHDGRSVQLARYAVDPKTAPHHRSNFDH